MDNLEVSSIDIEFQFREEVLNKKTRIDPYNSEDWYSLALGWALAKGISPDAAHNFAKLVRYYTDLK